MTAGWRVKKINGKIPGTHPGIEEAQTYVGHVVFINNWYAVNYLILEKFDI